MAGIWGLRRVFRKSTAKPANVEAVPSAATIEIGDFVINTIERTATLRGENLRLTSEEFNVLVFVSTHTQRCVTPRTVLATNWTDDDHHQTEFLKALLSLGRKLESIAGGRQYLRTEPWVIYRFEPRPSFAA